MDTRAAVLTRAGLDGLTVDRVRVDDPRGREVLVRVVACGLCHSDLHFIDGVLPITAPRILGHEMSGVVEAVGPGVTSVRPGDRVVACLAMSCGDCSSCLSGAPNLCLLRATLWDRPAGDPPRVLAADGSRVGAGSGIGGLAEHAIVDERGLVVVPDDMPLHPAALLGCAVVTGTGAVFRSAQVPPGASVAVIGCGGVGLSVIQAARICGAGPIVAVDRSSTKLAAAAALGATETVLSVAGSAEHLDEVRALTGGRGVDFAFEAVGLASTVADAVAMLALRGTATIVGVFPQGTDISMPARDVVNREATLKGSYMGSSAFRRDIPALCRMYQSGSLRLDEMIDPKLGLDDVRHGFDLLATGGAVRPLVVFDE